VLPQASSEYTRTLLRLVAVTLGLVRREWARMGDDWDASWAQLSSRVELATASAQLGAANAGAAYVPVVLAELGFDVAADGVVVPQSFVGAASDGRQLASLLAQAVIRAKVARGNGVSAPQALALGGRALDSYVHTQVVDAGRAATSVGIAARQDVGWVRMVSVPCCDRCAILAGKWFKFNEGFQRHPGCACTHIPAPEDVSDAVGTSPAVLFAGGHVRGLSKGQQAALADGADPARVVNAKQGMSTASQGAPGRRRMTPDDIYRLKADRPRTLELLRAHGYLT
jgi:hypothetical protein